MKKTRVTGKNSDVSRSLTKRKWFDRFTRVQILGAVTVSAGIILGTLLLQGDKTATIEESAALTNDDQPRIITEPAVNMDKTVIQGVNRPPVVNLVLLSPNIAYSGVPIRVEVKATDADEDEVRMDYTWKINGQVVVEQNGEEFDTTGLRKGDLVTVTVTPDDGKEQGKSLDSNGIVIQNRPPEIASMPPAGVSSGNFQYQVFAQDPDNEPLLFNLEGAPQGMTIDSTGLIQWDVPRGLYGKQQVRVIVSDGSASSFQTFNLNLGEVTAQ